MTPTTRPGPTFDALSSTELADAEGTVLLMAAALAFGISSKAAEAFTKEAAQMLVTFRAHEQTVAATNEVAR